MMQTRSMRLVTLSVLGVALIGCTKPDQNAANTDSAAASAMDTAAPVAAPAQLGPAEYTIVVKSRWTKAEHPLEWPSTAHFSGVIGASHNSDYSIFSIGTPPTPGLENLSEEGKHTPLDNEIRAAITAAKAGSLFESGPLRNFKDSIVTSAKVDDTFPLISLVMMVAPSPDWFTGVKDVDLRENGAWAQSKTLDLVAYDSGGDDGTTYMAPNMDTNPKKPTSQATTPHFVINGSVVPVGSVTFIHKQ
ncbi:MAG: spondin domain-containing protein [Gemmatimonadales bacterium]